MNLLKKNLNSSTTGGSSWIPNPCLFQYFSPRDWSAVKYQVYSALEWLQESLASTCYEKVDFHGSLVASPVRREFQQNASSFMAAQRSTSVKEFTVLDVPPNVTNCPRKKENKSEITASMRGNKKRRRTRTSTTLVWVIAVKIITHICRAQSTPERQ